MRNWKKNTHLVGPAILEELTIWNKFGVVNIALKTHGMNVMTSRYVAKWKITIGPDGERKKILRLRLTTRGFQDWFAHLDDNYAGTASRLSQRLVASEVACHPGWIIVTVDIEKAFLQGLTYREIQETTGGPEKFTNFSLPPGSAVFLR